MPTIDISDAAYERLKALAGPLFTVTEVLERLIPKGEDPGATSTATPRELGTSNSRGQSSLDRRPRERGVVVRLGAQRINAASVRDLYEQALKLLVDGGHMSRVDSSLPHRTSNQRYLIARKPTHPRGNPFIVPASYKGYHMEAHKNYENAVAQLKWLANKANLEFEYVS